MRVTGNVRATLFFSADVKEHKMRNVQSATTSLACSQHQAKCGLGWGPKVPGGLPFDSDQLYYLSFILFLFFFPLDLTFLRQGIAGIDGSFLVFNIQFYSSTSAGYPFPSSTASTSP
mgnify:CR=1 FL=1|jgi:hypothetical protein